MCLEKQDLCNKFKGRVRAVSPRARSPWVESKSMDYFFEGKWRTCGRPSAQEPGSEALLSWPSVSPFPKAVGSSLGPPATGPGPCPSSLTSWQGARGVHQSQQFTLYLLLMRFMIFFWAQPWSWTTQDTLYIYSYFLNVQSLSLRNDF